MSKSKRPSKPVRRNSGKVMITQAQLDALIAKAAGVQPVVETKQPEIKVEAKVEQPQPSVNSVPYSDKSVLAAHLAKARQAKANKDAAIKRLKELGIVPEDAVISSNGLKMLMEVMALAEAKGSPVLGMDQLKRLQKVAFTLGTLEQRMEVLEKALSLVLPIAISRPRQIVKEVERPAKAPRAARVEEPETETEAAEDTGSNLFQRMFSGLIS